MAATNGWRQSLRAQQQMATRLARYATLTDGLENINAATCGARAIKDKNYSKGTSIIEKMKKLGLNGFKIASVVVDLYCKLPPGEINPALLTADELNRSAAELSLDAREGMLGANKVESDLKEALAETRALMNNNCPTNVRESMNSDTGESVELPWMPGVGGAQSCEQQSDGLTVCSAPADDQRSTVNGGTKDDYLDACRGNLKSKACAIQHCNHVAAALGEGKKWVKDCIRGK
jgi:hypothetical protein